MTDTEVGKRETVLWVEDAEDDKKGPVWVSRARDGRLRIVCAGVACTKTLREWHGLALKADRPEATVDVQPGPVYEKSTLSVVTTESGEVFNIKLPI